MNYKSTPIVEEQEYRALDQARSGMNVYDSTGERIGEVSFVYLGATTEEAQERGEGPARDIPMDNADSNSFVDMVADAFNNEEIPSEMVERLRQEGYIRIDSSGLFAQDRFAMAEQIASVDEDAVRLNVAYDQLGTSL
jgi:sporulation protein YlmC with PRC-barrel domain